MKFIPSSLLRRGFSLVEALAAVAIVGIITFLALPNIVALKAKGDEKAAIARAEAFNLGVATFVNTRGLAIAASDWASADATGRYSKIRPYLAFSEDTLAAYMPGGYTLNLDSYSIVAAGTAALSKVELVNTEKEETVSY